MKRKETISDWVRLQPMDHTERMALQSIAKEYVYHREQFELWYRLKIKPPQKKNDFVTSMLNHIVKSELTYKIKKQLIDHLKNYTHLY